MRQLTPRFYKEFKCTASACSDSCCIGWEIDIDPKTYEFYRSVGGEFAQRLKSEIDHSEPPHFMLDKNERCRFLNGQNLCDIYINLGEEHLCDICAQHPRFHEWFGSYKESGLGLCCEEAARLLLTQKQPLSFIAEEIDEEDDGREFDEELLDFLLRCRGELFGILQDRTLPLGERLTMAVLTAAVMQDAADNEEYDRSNFPAQAVCSNEIQPELSDISLMLELFKSDDPIDPRFPERLDNISGNIRKLLGSREEFIEHLGERVAELEQVCVYFIYRYLLKAVWDCDLLSRVKLAAISTLVIFLLGLDSFCREGSFTLNSQIINLKAYSKEVEYSSEMVEVILDASWENEEFACERLIGIMGLLK